MARARARAMGSLPADATASFARPKALIGAFTTFVSPRLLPLRDCPITIEGRSWTTRRPMSTRKRSVSSDAIAFVSS